MPENKAFITSSKLSEIPGLVHAFFTRFGGVSKPPYDSLNVSWSNGDSAELVSQNLLRIKTLLGLERLVSSRQVHGDTINLIDSSTLANLHSRPPLLIAPSGDALVTDLAGTGLLIKVADCQPIFLIDPKARVAANVHCGWRGSVVNIPGKTVAYLRDRMGCDPGRMYAAVGPSLGPCCAEFKHYRDEIPAGMWEFQVRPTYFDFWALTRKQLSDAGIPAGNIDVIGRCTVCGSSEYFSYRAGGDTGRMAAVVGWRN